MRNKFIRAMLFLLFSYSSISSQGLAYIADVPIMEGAWFSKNFTQAVYNSDWELFKSEYMGLYLYDTKGKAFISDAHPDDVIAYYKNILAAVESNAPFTLQEIKHLKNMSPSVVRADGSEFGLLFSWIYKYDDDELAKLFITVTSTMTYKDEGGNSIFYFTMKKYKKDVVIEFPSHSELKAPLYPNVRYIPEESIKNNFMNTRVFLSTDSIENILTFYQANLKVKPFKGVYGGYGFRDYNKDSSDFISIEKSDSGEYKITYFLSAAE